MTLAFGLIIGFIAGYVLYRRHRAAAERRAVLRRVEQHGGGVPAWAQAWRNEQP